ncbi:hypothetical protein G4313_01995 [Coprococcus eutactus]|jgi:hypothetical protein|uniref:Uncharacterized protein n=1 Tax=Coprococcus ammoniilyticus TaxID=2981785 RepID=A0ABV1EH23_9FIRM|nr:MULTISPECIES: hypothetical protein [Clostridia]MDD6465775.1 hypothetical protein [Coprococcus sp.]RGH09005.1 hypothetical protein DWW39_08280 [Clostridium sp. AF15-31]RHV82223.1 hypothetical protein DXB01_01080 [Clostridium sp. OF10-22XD]CCY60203.1 uncharacterized protein BN572_01396 [Clostridium sp. CAG:264]SCH89718.1 Uncharacterised protein [uncultured Coprococcus sp.]
MGKGKLFKAAATIAAIGGVCYVFRDKIKNSTVYQSLDMDDKVEKVKNTIKEKMPAKEEPERNYFSLDDAPVEGTIDQQSENTSDISADNAKPEETEHSTEEAATVTEEIESPILYENEGLSDVSEDLDVIEEQDKLDV